MNLYSVIIIVFLYIMNYFLNKILNVLCINKLFVIVFELLRIVLMYYFVIFNKMFFIF